MTVCVYKSVKYVYLYVARLTFMYSKWSFVYLFQSSTWQREHPDDTVHRQHE